MSNHKYNLKPDNEDKRDYKFSDKFSFDKLPKSVDLRNQMPLVFDQGELGSCSSNASVADVMYSLGSETPILSRLYHYWKERNIEGTVNEDSGATLRDACKVMKDIGVCMEELFPYDISKYTETPTEVMNINAKNYMIKNYHRVISLFEVKQALALSFPIIIGMNVYESMETEEVADTGILPMPKRNEQLLGGHAVLVVGYVDSISSRKIKDKFSRLTKESLASNYLIVRNSWGENWGQKGYFLMSYEYFNKYVGDAWLIEK